jgi:hypothetical protein
MAMVNDTPRSIRSHGTNQYNGGTIGNGQLATPNCCPNTIMVAQPKATTGIAYSTGNPLAHCHWGSDVRNQGHIESFAWFHAVQRTYALLCIQ